MLNLNNRKVLVIEDRPTSTSPVLSAAVNRLAAELHAADLEVDAATSYAESLPLIVNRPDIDAVLLSLELPERQTEVSALHVLRTIREHLPEVPVFLLADRSGCAELISAKYLQYSAEFVWIFEDSPHFIAGRILAAISRYRQNLLPPLFAAIADYDTEFHEYSWAAPGHQGGIGFTKSAVGKKFYDFYDENLFRTDTGIERSSIGSLLDHTGAFEESEKMAAEVFGADLSFAGVVGSSGSNRTIMQGTIPPGEFVLCDRNCHKSIEQGLIITGARPIYLLPSRNAYGIIGPIPGSAMRRDVLAARLKASGADPERKLPYAVVTNCTYDGLCYHAAKVERALDESVDRIHFDEAWYAYARFNPLYRHCFAMRDDARGRKTGATVFATHSTHKLLTALSQSSFIHIRQGRKPVDFDHFNQAYMMHTTTSPLYAICASNDVAVKTMADSGPALTREVIDEAIDFRQALARTAGEFHQKHDWFFTLWNAPRIQHRGRWVDFADVPHAELATHQEYWWLDPQEAWHGFSGIDSQYVMLDPIKVSILTPGIDSTGKFADFGVPAELVSAYLYREGIVPTRSTDFQLMFLFSIGITRGKWVTLLNALLNFKRAYDANVPVVRLFPELPLHSSQYARLGLRDLGERMFDFIRDHQPTARLNAAYETLPEAAMIPREAFARLVADEVETLPLEQLPGRVSATAIIPYPPGIPMVMSGERFDRENCPRIAYLQSLQDWDAAFPGFEHETEGCVITDGAYQVMCVKE